MSNQHPADVILESSSVYWPTPNLSKATPHNAHSTPACVSQPSLGDALSCTFLDSTTDIRSKTYALRIVHGNSNPLLAKDIAQILQTSMTPAHVGRYANGEVNIQVLEPVRGDDCFIIQPTCGAKKQNSDSAVKSVSVNVNESLMELLLMIQTLRLASAKRITAVVPHFGYARQDRKTQARVPISASAVATMMATMGVDRVITMDLHCAQIQGFFQNIPVFDVSSASIFAQYIMHESNLDTQRVVVVAPDAGAVARARKLADMLHVPRIVTILKRRLCANKVESMQLVGEVKNAVCLIFDDMIDTAGTLCKAASVLVEWGAISVHAFATHGILTDPAISRITECTALTEVVVTDTIPQEEHRLRCPKLRVLSAARLIGEVIRRVHNEESFDNVESSVYDIPTRKSGSLGTDDEASAKCFLHHEIRK